MAASVSNTFLAIADIHLNSGNAAPITYGQDTNDILWASARAKLSTLITQQRPGFIVLMGDLPAHRDPANLRKNIGAVLTGLSSLNAISSNNIPVFYVHGNNDSLVVNYGPFSDGITNPFSLDPAHNSSASKGWPALNANPDCSVSPITACTYTTTTPMPSQHASDMANAQTRGYYSAYPSGSRASIRLISLNSVIFSHEYKGANQLALAQEEMDWLSAQLAAARANGEAVYIAMHIPMGADAFNHGEDMWNNTFKLNNGLTLRTAFLKLMADYKNTVRIVLSGHTHFTEIRALYADRAFTNLSVLGLGVPGLTPQHYNNPGIQEYTFDASFRLTEAKTHYTTPAAGSWNNYLFKNDYSCPQFFVTLLDCVPLRVIPYLAKWKLDLQSNLQNPYAAEFSLHAANYDPTLGDFSNWTAILNAVQVGPAE
jgi:predicted phosphodiesterase